jgi:hypothetical protein
LVPNRYFLKSKQFPGRHLINLNTRFYFFKNYLHMFIISTIPTSYVYNLWPLINEEGKVRVEIICIKNVSPVGFKDINALLLLNSALIY